MVAESEDSRTSNRAVGGNALEGMHGPVAELDATHCTLPRSDRGTPAPPPTVAMEEDVARLQHAMERLSDEHRELIILFHRENLTFEEIASRKGGSVETVRKNWALAVQRLATELKSSHEQRASTDSGAS